MLEAFRSVALEGRCIRYRCAGTASPTVVIDQGQGHSAEREFERAAPGGWNGIFQAIRADARIVMHDRAGLGSSSIAEGVRSCAQMVEDLRVVLKAAGAEPPYVLVGHSLGGFNLRCFAGTYPDEVAGMVLIDSSHPEQSERLIHGTQAAAGEDALPPPMVRRHPAPAATSEHVDFAACAADAGRVTSIGMKPLVVLSQSPQAFAPPGMPLPAWERMRRVWSELQHELLSLSGDSEQLLATHAGHFIPLEEPQRVIDAIRRVLHKVRLGARRLH